jgi:hypothetical protein
VLKKNNNSNSNFVRMRFVNKNQRNTMQTQSVGHKKKWKTDRRLTAQILCTTTRWRVPRKYSRSISVIELERIKHTKLRSIVFNHLTQV